MAMSDNYAFLRATKADHSIRDIPIIVTTLRDLTDADTRCLLQGALDFMTKPYHPTLAKRRVENAIRVSQSTTFPEIESMLRQLPSNIFLKDAEGRYVFCTHYWHHLDTGDDPNWTICGKTDLEVRKDRDNAILAMEADREIVRTGKGMRYVIEINTDGIQEFMELIKEPIFDDKGNVTGIIALINDVTDAENLRRQLETHALTDQLTGIGNRRAFDQYVGSLQERTDFPIAIISADCDDLKQVNDTYGHLVGDEYIRMAALAILTALPDSATVFRTGGDEFVAMVPDHTASEAEQLLEAIRKRAALFHLAHGSVQISLGVSMLTSPTDVFEEALDRADQNMYANKSAHKHQEPPKAL